MWRSLPFWRLDFLALPKDRNIGYTPVFCYFGIRTPGGISIKGEVLSSTNCLHPSFISRPAASSESSCKQTGEIEHRHSTFKPCVYHRLYIFHWICLKISPHIQTHAGCVCMNCECALCMKAKKKEKFFCKLDPGEKKKPISAIVEIAFEHMCKQHVMWQSTSLLPLWGPILRQSEKVSL